MPGPARSARGWGGGLMREAARVGRTCPDVVWARRATSRPGGARRAPSPDSVPLSTGRRKPSPPSAEDRLRAEGTDAKTVLEGLALLRLNGGRRAAYWHCDICALSFLDPKEFVDHLKQNHESVPIEASDPQRCNRCNRLVRQEGGGCLCVCVFWGRGSSTSRARWGLAAAGKRARLRTEPMLLPKGTAGTHPAPAQPL